MAIELLIEMGVPDWYGSTLNLTKQHKSSMCFSSNGGSDSQAQNCFLHEITCRLRYFETDR